MSETPARNTLFQIRKKSTSAEIPANQFEGTEYHSCRYIEGGISLSYSEIQSCATRHHGRGAPFLQDMRGDNQSIDLHQIMKEKNSIRQANQNGGHPDCKGCPNLELKEWEKSKYLFDWIAITNFIHCNLRCEYCWLTYAPHSPYNQPKKIPGQRYSAADLINVLVKKRLLSPQGIVDWGGGGEPTLIPEFDKLFHALAKYGVRQFLHTNAVRLPLSVKKGTLDASKLGIMCSIDAGNQENYAKIKGRDRFEIVFKNLAIYKKSGANINLKYIVQDCNSSEEEIDQFLEHVFRAGIKSVVTDVNHLNPELSQNIIDALKYFRASANKLGMRSRFDGCGAHGAERDLFNELNQPSEIETVSKNKLRDVA